MADSGKHRQSVRSATRSARSRSKRHGQGGPVMDIARSYGVRYSTISGLAA